MRLLAAIGKEVAAVPDKAAHALLLRDLDGWLRVQFLGVAVRTGIAFALPADRGALAAATGATDEALLGALLDLGVALGELRVRGGVYAAHGRRLRAIAGRADDLRGLVEELVAYASPIYLALGDHLRGGPPGDYLAGVGDAIARTSRLAEPVLAPVVRAVVRRVAPRSVLDVGCGTGVYLGHVRAVAPDATILGIDANAEVATGGDIVHASLEEVEGVFDLVLLLQNIYYWPPAERAGVFARLRRLAPSGTVAVASATARGPAVNRHLDLVLRVTKGSWRLPTAGEVGADLRAAGFAAVEVLEPVPGSGLVVALAS